MSINYVSPEDTIFELLANKEFALAKKLAAAIGALNGRNEVIICFSENGCFLKELEDMEKVKWKSWKGKDQEIKE